jgi:hypothetical protein
MADTRSVAEAVGEICAPMTSKTLVRGGSEMGLVRLEVRRRNGGNAAVW